MARRSSPARVLAPTALIVSALVVAFIVMTSGGGGTSTESPPRGGKPVRTATTRANEGRGKLPRKTYVVKPGDSLSSISVKTGIPVEKIQDLNPDVDPQALVSGQKIKLH